MIRPFRPLFPAQLRGGHATKPLHGLRHAYFILRAVSTSLVARCVEVQVEDNARRTASGQDVAPVTRASIHDQIKKRFHLDGVWGLIHLVLVRDRQRYHLDRPPILVDEADALIQRQSPKLFMPWDG